MAIHFYTPHYPLSTYVDLMWFYDDDISPSAQELALPSGTATLVINLRQRQANFAGAHSQPVPLDIAQLASHVGVHFRAGGVLPFLPLPVGTLHNQFVDLGDLWGRTAYALRDQLLETDTPQAKMDALEQALLDKLSHAAPLHPVVTPALQALQQLAPAGVEEVAQQLGLSSRRLHQIFYNEVGVTPKLYQRLQRFQQVLRQLHTRPTIDWADLAVEFGYYDQAHLINDFQTFAALTPTVYLAQPSREMSILTDSLAWRLNSLSDHAPITTP